MTVDAKEPVIVVDPLLGAKVGDYVIEALIGRGGMGLVYRAIHPLIERKVAVKVLKPEVASDPEQGKRFLTEARALSSIKHRGITDIISFGYLPDGRHYLVMELLVGEPLDALLERERSLDPVRALNLCDEVLDALSAAHGVGVVHRDLKPANIFLLEQSNGSIVVKLVDFGLARVGTAAEVMSSGKASVVAGTPEYIAPEQAHGQSATPRSDLYCLGVILFELMTGRLPFEDTGVYALVKAHIERPAPSLRTYVDVPESLERFVAELLEKDPEARPSSASAARLRVRRILQELQQQSTRVGVVLPLKAPTAAQVEPRGESSATMVLDAASSRGQTREVVPERRARGALFVAAAVLAVATVAGVVTFVRDEPVPASPVPPSPPVVEERPPAEALTPPTLAKVPEPATPPTPPVVAPRDDKPAEVPKKRGPKRIDRKAAVERWCSGPSWRDEVSNAAERAEKELLSTGRTREQDALGLLLSELRSKDATHETCAKNALKLAQLLAAGGQN